jgi:uncharacterized protein (DUF1330 family)
MPSHSTGGGTVTWKQRISRVNRQELGDYVRAEDPEGEAVPVVGRADQHLRRLKMPAYCFFDVLDVVDPEKLEKYRDGVLSTVERYGGRYLTVGGQYAVVEGGWQPVFPVLIEFPSLEEAHRWYDSEEYRELKALRHAAAKCNAVFIEGNGFKR